MGDDAAGVPVRDTVRRFILGGFEFKVNPSLLPKTDGRLDKVQKFDGFD